MLHNLKELTSQLGLYFFIYLHVLAHQLINEIKSKIDKK
jgi:hypothetical protein